MTDLIDDVTEQKLFHQFKQMAAESFISNKTRLLIRPNAERSVYCLQLIDISSGEVIKEQYVAKAISRALKQLDEFWDEALALQLKNILSMAMSGLDQIIAKKCLGSEDAA